MNRGPKEGLNACIGHVRGRANDCGFCSYLDISLFSLEKSIASLLCTESTSR